MCCFSVASAPIRLFGLLRRRPRLEVSGTRIFARVRDGVQWLAYSMSLATSSDVAMVLPLPVARVADDALTFVDLSGAPALFDELDDLFSIAALEARAKGGFRMSLPKLAVHRVGAFEASYVPRLADMDRLDARFRIPDEVWHQRADYAGFGFAVFKLRKGAKQRIHPMAMRFDTAEPRSIFFPTLHVHDGALHDTAGFDHALFFQAPDGSTRATGPIDAVAARAPVRIPSSLVDAARGVIQPNAAMYRIVLDGPLPNVDVRVAVA